MTDFDILIKNMLTINLTLKGKNLIKNVLILIKNWAKSNKNNVSLILLFNRNQFSISDFESDRIGHSDRSSDFESDGPIGFGMPNCLSLVS